MARLPSDKPTELELEILKVLWVESPLVVSEIRDRLARAGRDNAHTSVITMLNIMVNKGFLEKRKDGRSFLYWPKVAEQTVSHKMVRDIVERVFAGSPQQMMLNLLDNEEIDEAELFELRRLINKKVREQRQ